MNGFVAVGISHRTARVEERERFALDREGRLEAARLAVVEDGAAEALVLSTCNRTELYCAPRPGHAAGPRPDVLVARLARGREAHAATFFRLTGPECVRHAFRVAAGLDSQVLGETQILGQLRGAFDDAVAAGTAGTAFHRLFPAAFRAAKRAHAETAISQGAVSIGSVAVALAAKVFDDLRERPVVLFGAGDTGETVAVALRERGVGRFKIVGRGRERAAALAERLGGEAVPREAGEAILPGADIVLCAAHAGGPGEGGEPSGPLLTRALLSAVMEARRGRPLLVIDLGLPRNVDAAARDLEGLFLYDLDDLRQVTVEVAARRQREVPRVELLVEREVDAFARWWAGAGSIQPLVRDLAAHFDAVRRKELERTRARVPAEYHAALEQFSRSLVDKLLQTPAIRLRDEERAEHGAIPLLRRLFNLRGPAAAESHGGPALDAGGEASRGATKDDA